jgi:hypothetical protein
MLGYKLGYNMSRKLQSFASLVKDAGGVLYLDARKADGSGPLTGNDSPWVDLSGFGNNCTLFNQAGTAGSGWQSNPFVNRTDGTDDYGGFADTAILDITNAPLAIGVTFKKPVDDTGFIMAKSDNISSTNVQYGILHEATRKLSFYSKEGTVQREATFTVDSANYVNVIFYWDGANVTAYENGIQKAQTSFTTINSFGVLELGKRATGNYYDGDIATQTIYTGPNCVPSKFLPAEAKISAEYLALNP